jgi:predicted TIM-barrel fold metal-dependent hydrolase
MSRSSEVRSQLDHPVVDGDGHLIEHPTVLRDFIASAAPELIADFDRLATDRPIRTTGDPDVRDPAAPWWVFPTGTRDRATVVAPGLLAERLDEFGIDFSILYPSSGLAYMAIPDDDLRVATCRAVNEMNRELTAPYADRMTPAAVIPMHTPGEAIAALDHAVGTLGLKAAVIPPGVARPIPGIERRAPGSFPTAAWTDLYGLDSVHDYDPVWAAFQRHGVAVTVHGSAGVRYLPTARRSPTNYSFNHVGAHAFLQAEVCRALFIGGVLRRFPSLTFAFLEGGVTWAVQQLNDLREHWEKRRPQGLALTDPARLDSDELHRLLATYGGPRFGRIEPGAWVASSSLTQPVDDWAATGVSTEDELDALYLGTTYFGCEADDDGVRAAFPAPDDRRGRRAAAMFSSDIGHWDVTDMAGVVAESHELVTDGVLTRDDFRDFVFTHPVELHRRMNPGFFDGTRVAPAVIGLAQPAPV